MGIVRGTMPMHACMHAHAHTHTLACHAAHPHACTDTWTPVFERKDDRLVSMGHALLISIGHDTRVGYVQTKCELRAVVHGINTPRYNT